MFLLHAECSSESTLWNALLSKKHRRPRFHMRRTMGTTIAEDYWQEAIEQVCCSRHRAGGRAHERVPDATKLASARPSSVRAKLAAVIWVMPTITGRQGVEQLVCQIRATWQLLKEDQLRSVFESKRWHECGCVAHGSQRRARKSTLVVLLVLCSRRPSATAWRIIKWCDVHIAAACSCVGQPSAEKRSSTLAQAAVAGNGGRGTSCNNLMELNEEVRWRHFDGAVLCGKMVLSYSPRPSLPPPPCPNKLSCPRRRGLHHSVTILQAGDVITRS